MIASVFLAEPSSSTPSSSCPRQADTEALGEQLAPELRAGDLLVVSGPLGAGKTALVRGWPAGSVAGPVTSPTFVIAREHRPLPGGAGVPLVHVDAYRPVRPPSSTISISTPTSPTPWSRSSGAGVAERLAARHLLVRLERRLDEVRVAHVRWLGDPAPPALPGRRLFEPTLFRPTLFRPTLFRPTLLRPTLLGPGCSGRDCSGRGGGCRGGPSRVAE